MLDGPARILDPGGASRIPQKAWKLHVGRCRLSITPRHSSSSASGPDGVGNGDSASLALGTGSMALAAAAWRSPARRYTQSLTDRLSASRCSMRHKRARHERLRTARSAAEARVTAREARLLADAACGAESSGSPSTPSPPAHPPSSSPSPPSLSPPVVRRSLTFATAGTTSGHSAPWCSMAMRCRRSPLVCCTAKGSGLGAWGRRGSGRLSSDRRGGF